MGSTRSSDFSSRRASSPSRLFSLLPLRYGTQNGAAQMRRRLRASLAVPAQLPLDPRAPAAGDVGELFERDLARVAHRAHEHGAVGAAEVHALLGLGAG